MHWGWDRPARFSRVSPTQRRNALLNVGVALSLAPGVALPGFVSEPLIGRVRGEI